MCADRCAHRPEAAPCPCHPRRNGARGASGVRRRRWRHARTLSPADAREGSPSILGAGAGGDHHAGDPRRLPGRDPQQIDRHDRAGYFRPARLPACRQARDSCVQRGFVELSESTFGRLMGVAAAPVRQSGRKDQSLSRCHERSRHPTGIRMFRRRHSPLRRDVCEERHVQRSPQI